MPKGHKPGEASRKYKIKGAAGTSRKTGQAFIQQKAQNVLMRTRRCIVCLGERPRFGSYPVCPKCTRERKKKENE